LNCNDENTENIKKYILNVNSNINIYIGKYRPLNLYEFDKNDKYLVFSGIGNHLTFLNMIKNYGLNVFKDLEFPDHYHYKDDDINDILNLSETMGYKIITTEKDYLRIKKINKSDKINFIKSDLNIINEEKFINLITKKNETN